MAVHPTRKEDQPYRANTDMQWAGNLIQAQHEEALYAYGELVIITLMWRPIDFEQGLVQSCPVCFAGPTARQAAAFRQPTRKECPNCFGTTYEGGYRAQIIRPAIMADRNSEMTDVERGTVTIDTLAFETTADFTMHKGDYLFRYDNTRFQCEEKREAIVRDGFGPPISIESFAGSGTAHMEEQTSVAYLIPPLDPVAIRITLGIPGPFTVAQMQALDILSPNGYL